MYHLIAFIGGVLLDYIFGDPYWFPHPVRSIGKLIAYLEKRHLADGNRSGKEKRMAGKRLVFEVCMCVELVVVAILVGGYWLHPWLGCGIEMIMTYQMLAAKCLRVESMKVYQALEKHGVKEGRRAVAMIVGRDTKELSEEQVIKAAVETVAENTSDGVIAPVLYLAVGGPILAFLYKCINTMDSMVGYKSEKYLDYGRAAAKLDDIVNFLPARISGVLMVISCFFLGKDYNGKYAWKIFCRDRYQHASPNSAQTEAACAGALQIQLAGAASYFGVIHKKPYIGDPVRNVELKDIKRANCLMYGTAILCELACVGIMGMVVMTLTR